MKKKLSLSALVDIERNSVRGLLSKDLLNTFLLQEIEQDN